MLTTVSLNPSVDRRYIVRNFDKGEIFRSTQYEATAGGKALNAARVATSLGEVVFTTGLIGGKSGEFIQEQLSQLNIKHDFLKINGETRSCIAIVSDQEDQTEILESGPNVSKEEVERFLRHYEGILNLSSIIIASGSILNGMPKTIYYDMIKMARKKNVRFILDTSGNPLQEGIKAIPYLIKPNKEELEAIIKKPLSSDEEIILAANTIAQTGIEYVVISMGGKGSIIINNNKTYRVHVPNINVKNPVGSGDAMVAGFATSFARNYNVMDTIKFATACGTANAIEERTGSIDLMQVELLIPKITIEEIN
ncbi:1-phosphofructokinase [Tepidibacillus marianensis]|uniref:1-phosphofructokinase n=1 Tax=Tepidibacillus marianensis TaxID=3131995 RepID=UPI0030D2AA38